MKSSQTDFATEARTVPHRLAGTGRLKYNWSNISSFCFTIGFIRKANDNLERTGQYHIARKKIPSVLGPVDVSSGLPFLNISEMVKVIIF